MGYEPLDSLDEITKNRYEAVLVAARRARQLNAIRLAKLEMLNPENADEIDIDSRKVTAIALKDCLEGKVKFEREE